jgi:hypothetical protein
VTLWKLVGLGVICALGPAHAQQQGAFQDRLDALRSGPTPDYQVADPAYQQDINNDLARIGAVFFPLFGADRPFVGPSDGGQHETAAITLFTGPDCTACADALQELDTLATRLGLRANVIDTGTAENAALMDQLGLDLLPSYVMPDRMIRGDIPVFVLDRYLTAAP